MGGESNQSWRKSYSILVSVPHCSSMIYSRTSPIQGPTLVHTRQINGFQLRTNLCWDVDCRLVVGNTVNFPCNVRESVSDSEYQKERVRESVLERTCQRESESDCQREHVRKCVRKRVRERQSQMVRHDMSLFLCVRVGSMSQVSAPVLTGFL